MVAKMPAISNSKHVLIVNPIFVKNFEIFMVGACLETKDFTSL
jgi:hypothetical protein